MSVVYETDAEAWFNIALRPRKPEGSLAGTDSPGRPPRLSHRQLLNYELLTNTESFDLHTLYAGHYTATVLSPPNG